MLQHFSPRTKLLGLSAVACLCGCNTPESVSVFCASSSVTLTEAAPVLRDLGASCLRQANLRKPLGSFDQVGSDPACDEVAKQGDNAAAAAAVLARYFNAVNALAARNTAPPASASGATVSQAAEAFQARPAAQAALGSLAAFLTALSTSGYQRRALRRDLPKSSHDVTTVTDALASIVRENYLGQELRQEEDGLRVHYKEFAQTHRDPLVAVQLEQRWEVEQQRLEEKRRSAEALLSSLQTMDAGMAALAGNAGKLKSKELGTLLRPYTEQLQAAIPKVQEAF